MTEFPDGVVGLIEFTDDVMEKLMSAPNAPQQIENFGRLLQAVARKNDANSELVRLNVNSWARRDQLRSADIGPLRKRVLGLLKLRLKA